MIPRLAAGASSDNLASVFFLMTTYTNLRATLSVQLKSCFGLIPNVKFAKGTSLRSSSSEISEVMPTTSILLARIELMLLQDFVYRDHISKLADSHSLFSCIFGQSSPMAGESYTQHSEGATLSWVGLCCATQISKSRVPFLMHICYA